MKTYTLTIERFKGFTTERWVEVRLLGTTEAYAEFESEAVQALGFDMDTYSITLTYADLPCRELRFEDRLAAREG